MSPDLPDTAGIPDRIVQDSPEKAFEEIADRFSLTHAKRVLTAIGMLRAPRRVDKGHVGALRLTRGEIAEPESSICLDPVAGTVVSVRTVPVSLIAAFRDDTPPPVGAFDDPKAKVGSCTWDDAAAFCNAEGEQGLICDLSADGYRMAFEWEWEVAARSSSFVGSGDGFEWCMDDFSPRTTSRSDMAAVIQKEKSALSFGRMKVVRRLGPAPRRSSRLSSSADAQWPLRVVFGFKVRTSAD
jgi:hypothetical protein